jgi:CHAT domain-containing protein/tetratricopeptide (TPR) repeat protein
VPRRWGLWAIVGAAVGAWPAAGADLARGGLSPGRVVEATLAPDERHVYTLELTAGAAFVVRGDQREADLVLALVDEAGREVAGVDHLLGREAPEILAPASDDARTLRLQVAAKALARPARYRIELSTPLQKTPADRQRLAAERAASAAAASTAKPDPAHYRAAASRYVDALALWRQLGDRRAQALTLRQLGVVARRLGELPQAVVYFEQALPLWDEAADRELLAGTFNDLGLTHHDRGDLPQALPALERAIALYAATPNRRNEAGARANLCLCRLSRGETPQAVACFQEVLAQYRTLGELDREAETLVNLGGAYFTLGEPASALAAMDQALAKTQILGKRRSEAQILNNLGFFHQTFGELQAALGDYSRALAIFEAEGDRVWQARALNNLGYAYWYLGELARARPLFEQALALRRQSQDQRGEIVTLMNLGGVALADGAWAPARDSFQAALELSRKNGQKRNEARALDYLGRTYAAQGDVGQALALVGQALALHATLVEPLQRAEALAQLGRYRRTRGEGEAARRAFDDARAVYRELRFPAGEAQVLVDLAELASGEGRWQAALGHAEGAITLLEQLRVQVGSPDLRAAFLSARRDAYDLAVDSAMRLELHVGDGRHALRALELSEQARARTLLDWLRRNELAALPPTDAGELDALRRTLQAKAEQQFTLLGRQHGPREAETAARELQAALTTLEAAEAELRRRQPRRAELAAPATLAGKDLLALAEPGTLLLEVALGENASYLWLVADGRVAAYALPPRAELERLAGAAYQELSTLRATALAPVQESAAAALGRALLAPVAPRLRDGERLLIVPDGALAYIAFAALPIPGDAAGAPLLTRHEIVVLPSASALHWLRRAHAGRETPSSELAIFADPVFDARDPRLAPGGPREVEQGVATRGAFDPPRFDRLPASRREAETIAGLLPPDRVARFYDLAASREGLLAPSRARILHVASHGVIDAEHPELSGLALSMVDAQGATRDGFVRLRDLYQLDLAAELVVLSGCRTALGRELRSEGLVGLTRGFFYAGAPRVVASLWQVQDQATAELMPRFYRAMLTEGLRPAAALRRAQLEVRAQRRWRDPYHWAAFVLQGEWR